MGLKFDLGRFAGLDLINSLALCYLRLGSYGIFPKIINFVIGPANLIRKLSGLLCHFDLVNQAFFAENVRLRHPGTPLGTTTTSIA